MKSNSAQSTLTWLFSRRIDLIILAFFIVAGTVLRGAGVLHGSSFHPDERHMVMVTNDLERNGMNPKSFAYGSFSFYAVWGLSHLFWYPWHFLRSQFPVSMEAWSDPTEYDGIFLVGRVFCVAIGVLAIPLLYVLCCQLYRRSVVGLIAAAFLSFNVFHIQLSRFFTSDVTLTSLSLACIAALVSVYRSNSLFAYIAFGVLLGFATATKISSAFLATPLLVVLFLVLVREHGLSKSFRLSLIAVVCSSTIALLLFGLWSFIATGYTPTLLGYAIDPYALLIPLGAPFFFLLSACISPFSVHLSRASLALGIAVVVFAIAEPFAILDFKTFVANTHEQTEMVQGRWRPPYTIQYEHTLPYFFHLKQMLWYTMGWPLFTAVVAGVATAIARSLRNIGIALSDRTSRVAIEEIIPLTFVVVFFLATARFQVKFPRYLLPIYPLLFVFAAALFSSVNQKSFTFLKQLWQRRAPEL